MLVATQSRYLLDARASRSTAGNRQHCDQPAPTGGCDLLGLRRSKSACDVAILVAVGIPDVFVEDGSGGELGDFGILGLGTDAIAFTMRDFSLFFDLTSPPFIRVSSLFAKKLAVLANVLMSSTACSRRCCQTNLNTRQRHIKSIIMRHRN